MKLFLSFFLFKQPFLRKKFKIILRGLDLPYITVPQCRKLKNKKLPLTENIFREINSLFSNFFGKTAVRWSHEIFAIKVRENFRNFHTVRFTLQSKFLQMHDNTLPIPKKFSSKHFLKFYDYFYSFS